MAKKRLVFTLLYQQRGFYLSRNFRLQRVGDINWLQHNYRFASIATAIDELVILDVSRDQTDRAAFSAAAAEVSANCFMPLVLGGGIRSLADAETLVSNGADKIVLNTALATDPDLVRELVALYGSQCIIASVDYRVENGSFVVYTHQGRQRLDQPLQRHIEQLAALQVGELYLNSIDRDGTGQGYLLESLAQLGAASHLPVILAGGAGNQHHLLEGLQGAGVDAAATANLFNFIGDGLPRARAHLLHHGIAMARW
jgi:cyclase